MDRSEARRLATKTGRVTVSAVRIVNAKAHDLCEFVAPRAPRQVKDTVAGALTGVAAAAAIGGVGVAALGTGVALPTTAVLTGLGALVGNRIGIFRDQQARRAAAASGAGELRAKA